MTEPPMPHIFTEHDRTDDEPGFDAVLDDWPTPPTLTFTTGQRLLVQGKYVATVVGQGWSTAGDDSTHVWVTFGQATVPSRILRSLCEPMPGGDQ